MKLDLEKMSPQQRARFVRRLELASDNPFIDPEARWRAERLLHDVKTRLRYREMFRARNSRWTHRVSPTRYIFYLPWACSCGARGGILYQRSVFELWLPPDAVVRDVEGDCILTANGDVVCPFPAEAHPAAR